ncbi:MAG: hypothetical protein WD003_01865 [Candidatus Paceibacterota bacterium]
MTGNPLQDIVFQMQDLLDAVVPLLITLALLFFIWGVAKFVTAKEAEEKEKARDIMIYGAIGLFVIVSIWGIVAMLQVFTNVDTNAVPDLPFVPTR